MAQFVIECPACGKPIQAGTGLFSKKKVNCNCGFMIDVSAERMAEKQCPHCGNMVVYDRKKSDSAKCPVCHARINAGTELVRITCPSCNAELTADKSAKTYTCPQCKTLIDVQARVEQEKNSGKTSVIKWDMGMNDIFLYRHPVENFNIGSQLIVSEGQKAVFFRNGKGLDVFGPGRHILETQKLPLLNELFRYPTDAELTFDSRVYFVRTNRLNVKWGVPEIRLRNPEMEFYVDIGISGSMDLQLMDDTESARKLIYMILGTTSGAEHNIPVGGGESYTTTYFSEKFRDVITTRLSDLMANIIIDNRINVLDIESKKIVISDFLRRDYNKILEEYGLVVPINHFNISAIKIHNNEDVNRWRQQEADRSIRTREEKLQEDILRSSQGRIRLEEENYAIKGLLHKEAEAGMAKLEARGQADAKIISSEAEAQSIKLTGSAAAEAYQAQAMAEAAEMRAKGYSYGQESAREIGLAAMKNGLPGTGSGAEGSVSGGVSGSLGHIMGLGIELGAMGSVMGMTKEMLSPSLNASMDIGKSIMGNAGSTGQTCPNCGLTGITSRFCPDCGSPMPIQPSTWDCPGCGKKGITSVFCPDCGQKRV